MPKGLEAANQTKRKPPPGVAFCIQTGPSTACTEGIITDDFKVAEKRANVCKRILVRDYTLLRPYYMRFVLHFI